MKPNLSRIIPLALVAIAFPLTATASAQDTETVLYTFDGTHGSGPGSLIEDSAGNFYGTTQSGGNASCAPTGCGVIFKLSNSGGHWVETIIHAFTGGTDGSFPLSIITDAQGNIFGVDEFCGAGRPG